MVVSAVVDYFDGRSSAGCFMDAVTSVVDYSADSGSNSRLVGVVFGTGACAIHGGCTGESSYERSFE